MNQQNNDQALLPRRSRRLATIIPASHWISMGYSEIDAFHLQRLQNEIKMYCDGSNDTIFSSNPTDINIRGRPGGILAHHDMMIPHWQKLFKTLRGRTKINFIKILCISLPVPVLDIMFPTLHTMNLKDLTLYQTGLGSGGLLKLSSYIKESTSIQNLTIGGTFNLSVARSLSDAVKEHPSLERIGFIKCGFDDNILRKMLESVTRLRVFGLSIQNLGLESVNVIADFIHSNYPIDVIQLGRTSLSDSDVAVLASALKQNTHLKRFDLRNNNDITEEGDKFLLKAMYDPTSMDSIIESNHRCKAYTYDVSNASLISQRPPIETEVLYTNGKDDRDISLQRKIRKKVVLALCGVDGGLFDLSHLNDLPLPLMPRVLELIQEHTKLRKKAVKCREIMPVQLEKDALSRLFHTLRGWELPLLFENLGSPFAKGTTGKRKRRKTRR